MQPSQVKVRIYRFQEKFFADRPLSGSFGKIFA